MEAESMRLFCRTNRMYTLGRAGMQMATSSGPLSSAQEAVQLLVRALASNSTHMCVSYTSCNPLKSL